MRFWKLTITVRVGLDPRSWHPQRQTTFPDNEFSYSPCHVVSHYENLTPLFFLKFFSSPRKLLVEYWKNEYGERGWQRQKVQSPRRGWQRQKVQDYLGWSGWKICEWGVRSLSPGRKWWWRDAEFDEEYSEGGQTSHRTSKREVGQNVHQGDSAPRLTSPVVWIWYHARFHARSITRKVQGSFIRNSVCRTHRVVRGGQVQKYFPSSWKDDALGFLSMDFQKFLHPAYSWWS